jgi:hypothetical protein
MKKKASRAFLMVERIFQLFSVPWKVVPPAYGAFRMQWEFSRGSRKREPLMWSQTPGALKRRLKMKNFISAGLLIQEDWRNVKMQKKAPREKGLSTISRGSLHPVKLNLLFIIGEKSARM